MSAYSKWAGARYSGPFQGRSRRTAEGLERNRWKMPGAQGQTEDRTPPDSWPNTVATSNFEDFVNEVGIHHGQIIPGTPQSRSATLGKAPPGTRTNAPKGLPDNPTTLRDLTMDARDTQIKWMDEYSAKYPSDPFAPEMPDTEAEEQKRKNTPQGAQQFAPALPPVVYDPRGGGMREEEGWTQEAEDAEEERRKNMFSTFDIEPWQPPRLPPGAFNESLV